MKLTTAFFSRPAEELAPLLLGKFLCRRLADGKVIRRAVTETEAYCGESDTACHARRGKTPRTRVMYEKAGTAYVYLCYGIHCLFNIIAAEPGEPQGVLIRGVANAAGPGRVTKHMHIDMGLNGQDLSVSEELWLEDGPQPPYRAMPRVGIQYASEWDRQAPLRFISQGSVGLRTSLTHFDTPAGLPISTSPTPRVNLYGSYYSRFS